jgi:hypothetical protein
MVVMLLAKSLIGWIFPAKPAFQDRKSPPGLCEQITKLEPGEPSANDEVFHISLPI